MLAVISFSASSLISSSLSNSCFSSSAITPSLSRIFYCSRPLRSSSFAFSFTSRSIIQPYYTAQLQRRPWPCWIFRPLQEFLVGSFPQQLGFLGSDFFDQERGINRFSSYLTVCQRRASFSSMTMVVPSWVFEDLLLLLRSLACVVGCSWAKNSSKHESWVAILERATCLGCWQGSDDTVSLSSGPSRAQLS